MKLNQNSFSAKVYRWFYDIEVMPTNLCPYFWKLSVALVFCIPFAVITLPYTFFYRDKGEQSFITRIGISAIIYFMLAIAVSMFSVFGLFFKIPEAGTLYSHIIAAGFVGWAATLAIGVKELIEYLVEKIRERKYREVGRLRNGELIIKERKPSLIVEMIKAKYNKYCPQIKWEKR